MNDLGAIQDERYRWRRPIGLRFRWQPADGEADGPINAAARALHDSDPIAAEHQLNALPDADLHDPATAWAHEFFRGEICRLLGRSGSSHYVQAADIAWANNVEVPYSVATSVAIQDAFDSGEVERAILWLEELIGVELEDAVAKQLRIDTILSTMFTLGLAEDALDVINRSEAVSIERSTLTLGRCLAALGRHREAI